jgi:hypothetical protein
MKLALLPQLFLLLNLVHFVLSGWYAVCDFFIMKKQYSAIIEWKQRNQKVNPLLYCIIT